MSPMRARILPWLAGYLLTVNLYLVPTVAASPRATDLVGVLLGVWAVWALAGGRLARRPVVLAALAALAPALWLFFAALDREGPTLVQAGRWLLAVPWALALVPLLDDPDRRRRFAWGLIVGGAVNVAVIVLQVLGLEGLLRAVGLSSSGAAFHNYVLQMVRFPGLHGHHNASAAVISLMVPAVLYLYFRRECSLAVLLATLTAVALALHLTSTRSPLVATLVTLMFAAVATRRVGRVAAAGLLLVAIAGPLVAVYGPPGGWSRWRDIDESSSNAQERLISNYGAAALALEHPWGWGAERGAEMVKDRTSISATHNAYLQAALYFSVPFGLLVLAGVVTVAVRALGGGEHPLLLPGLLAVQAGVLFLFEEHFNNPTFMVLALWWVVLLGAGPGDPRSVPEDHASVG